MTAAEPCAICGDTGQPRTHRAREMMFGFRDAFTYGECGGCGCLALLDPPADLNRYYPPDYYAFGGPPPEPRLRTWLRQRWAAHLLGRRNLPGALLDFLRSTRPPGVAAAAAVGMARPAPSAAILDVGSGAWGVLHLMRAAGFTDLTGADPYLTADRTAVPGLVIRKAWLHELEGSWDVVLMSHSLEHMPDHHEVFRTIHRLLTPGGVLVVRTPLAGRSWREFGTDWVELDAPRHLLIHTEASLRLLAAQTGFDVERVVFDATADELWGSVQYRADIALREPRSWLVDPHASMFRPRDIRAMERHIRQLNRTGEAGRASFVLRRS